MAFYEIVKLTVNKTETFNFDFLIQTYQQYRPQPFSLLLFFVQNELNHLRIQYSHSEILQRRSV